MVWQFTPCSVILRNAVSSLSSCTMLYNAVSCSAEIWAFFALLSHSPFTAVPFERHALPFVGQQPIPAMVHTHLLMASITFLHHSITIS